jgi:hypothetical protein
MCSRSEAIFRLMAAWLDRAMDEGPEFYTRVTLANFLDTDVIDAVARGDLLSEHSEEKRQAEIRRFNVEAARQQELVAAWRSPDTGRRQS